MTWRTAQLGDICSPKQHKTIPASNLLDDGFPVYGANGQIGFYSEYTHEDETVAITCRGATCGTINVAPAKSYITGNAMALDDLDKRRVDLRFLVYALRNRGLHDVISGSAQPQITRGPLLTVEIPLPPLEEQKRIAAILDQTDDLRRKRQRALDRFNQLGQAIFMEMFGDLVFSKDGAIALGDVCDVRDGTHDSPKYVDVGFPLLTSKNFSGGSINYTDAKLISEDVFIKINKRSKVDKGDIIMPMIGTIGGPVIVDFDPDFAIKNVALIKFTNSTMNPEFIREVLDGQLFKSHVTSAGRGGTQKFISLGDIRGFKIPLPSIDQQNLFARRISTLRTEGARHAEAQKRNEDLFMSLQHRAFRGELTASSLKDVAA